MKTADYLQVFIYIALLIALTRRQTWAVYGDSPSDFLQRQILNIGCVAPYSIVGAIGGQFQAVEPGEDFAPGLIVEDAQVELLADSVGQAGDFTLGSHIGSRGS